MTEETDDGHRERLDLRALDVGPIPLREDATVQGVLARITTRSIQPEWQSWMVPAQRGLAAAAAVFILLAGAMVFLQRGPTTGTDATALIESWVATGQVPTNGELLTAYMGYRR
jgi:hypothetical protein